MHSWHDSNNQRHDIKIDYSAAQRLKSECDVDLLEAYKSPALVAVVFQKLTDDETLVGCLCVLEDVPEQSVDQWMRGLGDADVLRKAREALLMAVTDFFPQELRPGITDAIQAMTTALTMSHLDCITPVFGSTTDGNGSSESSAASVGTQTV